MKETTKRSQTVIFGDKGKAERVVVEVTIFNSEKETASKIATEIEEAVKKIEEIV